MIFEAVEFHVPGGMSVRRLEAEESCVQNLIQGNARIGGLDDPRARVQRHHNRSRGLPLRLRRQIELVEAHNVSKLDLVDQEFGQRRPMIVLAEREPSIG
jgi:hypothetical protein